MKVVLLAAGRSTRMSPLSDKNFLKFLGKPLIAHQIETIRKVLKPKEIIIVGGAHNLASLEKLNAKITIVEQKDLVAGMAGALLAAEKKIGKEPFLVVSANDIVDKTCYQLIKKFLKKNTKDSAIVGCKVKSYFPGGYLTVDGDRVTGIVEKPGEGKEPSDLVNIVVHFHRDAESFFKTLKGVTSDHDDRYEVTLSTLLKKGVVYRMLHFKGIWKPIKYPWHVLSAKDFFLATLKKHISRKAIIASAAVIRGNVIIEDGVRVFDNAVIQGPCYIGKGSIVASGSLVRESILGERCVVGHVTEIARSYLADDVWTHKNYVGDSIIDSNCSFGSGTVTGNLRLDEEEIFVEIKNQKIETGTKKLGLICGKNVRSGVNTSFMPGVKIGPGSLIGAGIVVAEDIPRNSYVTGDWKLKVRENAKRIGNRKELFGKLLK